MLSFKDDYLQLFVLLLDLALAEQDLVLFLVLVDLVEVLPVLFLVPAIVSTSLCTFCTLSIKPYEDFILSKIT